MGKIKWKSKEQINQEKQQAEQQRKAEEEKKKALEEVPGRVAQLENENLMLMLAAAESYEQMFNENQILMLAVAEVYEELIELKFGGVE